ncbi:Ankyrin repeat-containing domain protein [Lactarius tabidus]
MKSLFDLAKPHFAMWTTLYDIDAESGGVFPPEKPSPLYYSALCGFDDLVGHLLVKHPQDVNAIGGSFEFPLFAAICGNHLQAAEVLLQHGGCPDAQDTRKKTALHRAIDRQNKVSIDAVRLLLTYGADVNAQRDDLWTPLHLAVDLEELRVVRILLEFGADANSRNDDGLAPLHLLSRRETSRGEADGSDVAKLLLDHGANVDEKGSDNATPLHLACYNQKLKIVRVLLDYGANVDVEKNRGETPLQLALTRRGHHDAQNGPGVARLLLEHGAEAYGRDTYHISSSDLACCFGNEKIGQVLLVDGGKFKPGDNRDQTAFWLWIEECSVGGRVQDKYDTILLHSASYHGRLEMVRTLLENGVKSNTKNHRGETALHVVSRARDVSQDSARLGHVSLERGVDGSTQDTNHDAEEAGVIVARLLLEHGANANAKTWSGETPLDLVSDRRPKLAQVLREHRAKVKPSSSRRTSLFKRK